jgi:hypothetical protein
LILVTLASFLILQRARPPSPQLKTSPSTNHSHILSHVNQADFERGGLRWKDGVLKFTLKTNAVYMICLLTAVGSTLGGSSAVQIYTKIIQRTTQLILKE